jgi:methyl-accepting chemotaxis protein
MTQIQKAAVATGNVVQQALARVDEALTQLRTSRAAVDKLTMGVASALVEMRAVLALIDTLEESDRRIEKIVDGIGLIALQTTMLAVSGSVEAARAGEQGQGFAIVSNDIRTLAKDAAANAERVKDLIRAIHAQVMTVRRDIEQIIGIADAELQRNRQITEKVAHAEATVAELRAGNAGIATTVDAIVETVKDVVSGTQQIAAVAEEASNAAAQAATAAREQAQGAEDLAAAIEEIASLADELRKSEH